MEGIPVDANTHIGPPDWYAPDAPRDATVIVNYNGFPEEAMLAFDYAVDIWSVLLTSEVTVRIDAYWTDLGSGALAQAGPSNLHQNFANAPISDTYYPAALANALAGEDLSEQSDLECTFNSTANWYLGTDGNTPLGTYDFVTAALHELAHGLGFIGSAYYINGFGFLAVYALIGIPIARISDRGAYGLVISGCLTLWGVMTMLGGAVQSGFHLALTRVGVAIGEAGSTPAAHAYVARNFVPERRAAPLAVITLAIPLASAASLIGGGLLAEALGWQPTLSTISQLKLHAMRLPALVHLTLPSGPHFSVLVGLAGQRVILADPSQGFQWWSREQFVAAWAADDDGVALTLTASPAG